MSDTITYQYKSRSVLERSGKQDSLTLAKYSEVQVKAAPCFFWGKLTSPYLTSRCLIALSNVVQSSFNLSPFQLSLLKDPIVTAGNQYIRFEGFSHCAGVYARVDVTPEGHDGEFLKNGTTNVDFNPPMIAALGDVKKKDPLVLSVGKKEVSISNKGKKTVERKVPLPTKWIKGLSTVQMYLADSTPFVKLNKLQTIQLFRSLPKGKIKTDYYLLQRGKQLRFSPVKQKNSVCIGGLHRLRLLDQLLPLVDSLEIFSHPNDQSSTWQLQIGPVRFLLSLSREPWRGFSGEGAALEALITDVPAEWIEHFDDYSYANQNFNPTLLSVEKGLSLETTQNLAAQLSAMGLLGYDLSNNVYFHRRLPFKMSRILGLNPRLKNAEKLIEQGKVKILSKNAQRIEASVAGTGVWHTVILEGEKQQCTCTWFSKNQGERGVCKHILAVKKTVI